MRGALRESRNARVAVSVNFGRDLQALELAHDVARRGDEVRLIDVHRIEMERPAPVLRERVVLVGKGYRALVESLVAVILCKSRRRDERHAHRVAAAIFDVRRVRLHPARRCTDKHLLVERLLKNLRHFQRVDCHELYPPYMPSAASNCACIVSPAPPAGLRPSPLPACCVSLTAHALSLSHSAAPSAMVPSMPSAFV